MTPLLREALPMISSLLVSTSVTVRSHRGSLLSSCERRSSYLALTAKSLHQQG